ncbi:hypothetical protein DPMN_150291 [Dreissena polymorpha]|uniref:Uncharacterized protein n=1 Tax=Dreissena polymorpha TaxID=45954 RepID=A0A9D4FHH1_DREPO|nr:hypothetical protein DPMN_150291 [Dreissena polymorpha]
MLNGGHDIIEILLKTSKNSNKHISTHTNKQTNLRLPREKRRYYRAILRAEAGIEEGDEEVARITLGELEPTQVQSPAPPMMWDKRQPQTGPTVRKSYPVLDFKEPKPPLSTCRNCL